MTSTSFLIGDSITVLRTLPAASVDLILSSPPYLALRSYLPADDPNKAQEIGSEPTPEAFIDVLLDVTEECRRVLAPHGTLAFELGDTYAGGGQGHGRDALGIDLDDRAAWLEQRRQGIGGSDAAAACGLSPWKSPLALWLEKTGQLDDTPAELPPADPETGEIVP